MFVLFTSTRPKKIDDLITKRESSNSVKRKWGKTERMARSSFGKTVKQERKKQSGIIEGGTKRQTRQHNEMNEMQIPDQHRRRSVPNKNENSQLQSLVQEGCIITPEDYKIPR